MANMCGAGISCGFFMFSFFLFEHEFNGHKYSYTAAKICIVVPPLYRGRNDSYRFLEDLADRFNKAT